jgi:hypothetical protein
MPVAHMMIYLLARKRVWRLKLGLQDAVPDNNVMHKVLFGLY